MNSEGGAGREEFPKFNTEMKLIYFPPSAPSWKSAIDMFNVPLWDASERKKSEVKSKEVIMNVESNRTWNVFDEVNESARELLLKILQLRKF